MRYGLSDYEWSVIKPMLPNKPHAAQASGESGSIVSQCFQESLS
jgi:hypothetical protein